MKKFWVLTCTCLLVATFLASPLWSEEHFYTYLGITLGGGINQIEYSDWFTDHQETANISGTYYSGGMLFAVFVRELVGEFSLQYIANSNGAAEGGRDTSVQHLLYTFTGKYAYPLGSRFFATGGIGLYIETPPATASYDGGGGPLMTAGCIVSISPNWKFIFDLQGRYGQFGMGEDSTKLSYGINVGVVINVGRI
ncbi:MAG TPA: hypothetical protein PLI62_03450 [Spirochaetota bacterium]|nr:hypothetical protein [Spirochaetota bacterium]